MSLDYPVPVQDAISVGYKIDARTGAAIQNIIEGLWGDVGRVQNVTGQWNEGAELATGSIGSLRSEIKKIADEHFWQGPAKDSYQAWIELLIDQTLEPVEKGLRDTFDTLDKAADTISDMRNELIKLCVSFTGAVASLVGSGTGIGFLALVGFGAWFVVELLDFQDSYVNALDGHTERMERIHDKTVGAEVTTTLDPAYPIPATKMMTTPPLNKGILGDWDNWEHENPKIEKP